MAASTGSITDTWAVPKFQGDDIIIGHIRYSEKNEIGEGSQGAGHAGSHVHCMSMSSRAIMATLYIFPAATLVFRGSDVKTNTLKYAVKRMSRHVFGLAADMEMEVRGMVCNKMQRECNNTAIIICTGRMLHRPGGYGSVV